MNICCVDVSYVIIPSSSLVDILIIFSLLLLHIVLQLRVLYICIFVLFPVCLCDRFLKVGLLCQRRNVLVILLKNANFFSFEVLCYFIFPPVMYENAWFTSLSPIWIYAILMNEKRCFILEQGWTCFNILKGPMYFFFSILCVHVPCPFFYKICGLKYKLKIYFLVSQFSFLLRTWPFGNVSLCKFLKSLYICWSV